MKYLFLLDENVILSAQNWMDQHGKEDLTSSILLQNIIYNCHKLVINEYLLDKYYKKTSKTATYSMKVIRLLKQNVLINSKKHEWVYELPSLQFEDKIPEDDLQIVKMAFLTRALFITMDSRLRGKLEELKLPLTILEPKDALEFAQLKDP